MIEEGRGDSADEREELQIFANPSPILMFRRSFQLRYYLLSVWGRLKKSKSKEGTTTPLHGQPSTNSDETSQWAMDSRKLITILSHQLSHPFLLQAS